MSGLIRLDSRLGWLCVLLAAGPMAAGCEGGGDDDDAADDDAAGDDDAADDDVAGDDDAADDDTSGDDDTTGAQDCEGGVCIVSGTLVEDAHWTANNQYLLRGGVFIGDDVNETTLTIDAGTQVYGETSTVGMLVVRRGSKIYANGTEAAPVVFTSSLPQGSRAPGDWGGLIINGRATLNTGEEAFGEGGTGWYGGGDDGDDSGALSYVRVEFAGQLISPENELNGIAFQGVGSGTRVDHVQAHMTADDAFEFYGGAVNWKHLLATGPGDDALDWTDGWRGKGQFAVVQQYAGTGDNGIEADNNAEDNEATPRSHPVLSHLTLIGSPDSDKSDWGVLLREGTAANLHNVAVLGWNDAGLMIDHDATFQNAWSGSALSGELTITGSVLSNATNFEAAAAGAPFGIEEFFTTLNAGNSVVADWNGLLQDAFDEAAPSFVPKAGSPLESGGASPSDNFFESVTFRGGVDPAADWTAGWTATYRD
ncbi:hypothetical protein L6R50_02085 [Myxococcota bacterium]|nr:hypothetical protein [Myxococcota bacterium]